MAAMVESQRAGAKIESIGGLIIRYGLVLILLWIGGMKFTAYEAEGLKGIVSTSPLLSWGYQVFSLQGFSNLLGVIEIAFAVLIAARPFAPLASAVGSFGATGMFLITLSFLLLGGGSMGEGLWFSRAWRDRAVSGERFAFAGRGRLDDGRIPARGAALAITLSNHTRASCVNRLYKINSHKIKMMRSARTINR